ncbi:hypothetical protein [uncultured Paraglaciecola sp.]|uniref:hypothetical protein n=1 Tax=uncultured Paraglaciecola sp. TaxID=1765024 RepID=UPI0026034713|nr:hypothetical protein [uncultured Paraglaciecola sp.]
MRERKVTALYCDHCNKRGFQRPSMARHERTCTANPQRECGMCQWMYENNEIDIHGKSVAELYSAIGEGGDDGLARLREASNDCPACMLSAIRMLNKANDELWKQSDGKGFTATFHVDFDWKAERDRWNETSTAIMNEQQQDAGGYY